MHYHKDDFICELNKTNILVISQVMFHHVSYSAQWKQVRQASTHTGEGDYKRV